MIKEGKRLISKDQQRLIIKNMETLKSFGYEIVDARPGLLACGVVGDGCLADNETILKTIENQLK